MSRRLSGSGRLSSRNKNPYAFIIWMNGIERAISRIAAAREKLLGIVHYLHSIEGIDRSVDDYIFKAMEYLKMAEDRLFDELD